MLLLDVPVVFICPDHNEKYRERKEYMFDFLKKLGFKNVTMFKSGSESYPLCLIKATQDILESRLDNEPILLLEDDIELTEWVSDMNIEIPEDTDAFYLGLSRYAAASTENYSLGFGSTQFQPISDIHIRILNMLSTHAIMYVSKRYKEAVMNEMKKIINTGSGYINDIAIARIQKDYNIYAYKYPFFYQSDKFGNQLHVKDATNFRF